MTSAGSCSRSARRILFLVVTVVPAYVFRKDHRSDLPFAPLTGRPAQAKAVPQLVSTLARVKAITSEQTTDIACRLLTILARLVAYSPEGRLALQVCGGLTTPLRFANRYVCMYVCVCVCVCVCVRMC